MAKPTTTKTPSKQMYFGLQGNINSKQISKRFTQDEIQIFKDYGINSDIGLYILESLVVKYGNKEYITVHKKHIAKNSKGRDFSKTLQIKIKSAAGKDSESLRDLGLSKDFLRELLVFLNESCKYIADKL